jgi:hypothetical protein
MSSITISFLNGKKLTVEVPQDGTTMREFLIQIAPLFGDIKQVIWGDDFIWSLLKLRENEQPERINTFENRHKRVSELLKPGDRLFAQMWILGSPANSLVYKNNLLETGYSYDTCCGICLDDFSEVAVYDKVLPCKHKFHYRCLAQLQHSFCPMCNAAILDEIMDIVRKYVRDEKPELISL